MAAANRMHRDIERIIEGVRSDLGLDLTLVCHDSRDLSFAASFDGIEYIYTDRPLQFLAALKACRALISYRLHGFLPAMSLGTPAVNLSYDERGQSLVETVGYGDWNIDVFSTSDVPAAVASRMQHLDDLTSLRNRTSERHDRLYQTMADGIGEFIGQIKENEE